MTAIALHPTPLKVFLAASPVMRDDARAYLQAALGRPVDPVDIEPCDIADAISRHEQDDQALVVLARDEGEGGGPCAAVIALDSPVPVMVLRVGRALPVPTRVVVPLDGSSRAAQALPVAARIAVQSGLPVHLVMVIDPSQVIPPAFAYDPDSWTVINELRSTAHWALRQAEDMLRARGIAVESSLLYGPVRACLQGELRQEDMVVMTTHGTGRGGACTGRVASSILGTARGPVVVHRGVEPEVVAMDSCPACSSREPLSVDAAIERRA